MRRSGTLMFVGLSIATVSFFISTFAPKYVIKQYEPFESLAQLKNTSSLNVKCKFEKTKIKFAFSKKTMGFHKYPPFSQYYLQIVEKDGKNIAVFAPNGFSNENFAGRVIAREDNESIHSVMNNYETEHPGFRFESSAIVSEQTSAMRTIEIISNVLLAISFILGIILWRMVKKHYLL
jgi:hypothetical protein